MDSKEELIKAFEFIGQNVNDEIIDTCISLCVKYDIMIEDFVDQWSAFSITNLKSGPVSLDGILLLERKELSKLSKNSLNTTDPSISTEVAPKNTPKSAKRPRSSEDLDESDASIKLSALDVQDTQEEVTEPDGMVPLYSERSGSGEIVVTYGAKTNLERSDINATVNIIAKSVWYDPEKFRYLHATQSKVANAFNDAIDFLTDIILMKNQLGSNSDVNISKSDDAVICGRIRSEDFGRLNVNTVKLESSYFFNGAKTTALNINKAKRFSLFPGQIVAVQGIRMFDDSFIAQEIFANGLPDFNKEDLKLTDNLQIVVAAGPFTTSDNFLYEPLQDLLRYVAETKPNILILLGPFIDASHCSIIDMTETFEDYFNNLIETIMGFFKFEIQVILIPSTMDAHHHPIYPTSAYQVKQKYPNLICAPNPCLLNINGVVIGTTSIDTLFHLTKEETSRKPQIVDRIARLASHLLNQRSFYPLYPNDKDTPIDYRLLLNNCRMEVKPHIIILPSTLRYCVKEVEKCLFINPERLVKNRVGGTFARITINPVSEHSEVIKNISCQIRKI